MMGELLSFGQFRDSFSYLVMPSEKTSIYLGKKICMVFMG
jgi:hypothetical protein